MLPYRLLYHISHITVVLYVSIQFLLMHLTVLENVAIYVAIAINHVEVSASLKPQVSPRYILVVTLGNSIIMSVKSSSLLQLPV